MRVEARYSPNREWQRKVTHVKMVAAKIDLGRPDRITKAGKDVDELAGLAIEAKYVASALAGDIQVIVRAKRNALRISESP